MPWATCSKAENEGLLHPLSTRTIQHRVSFYADDVVLFLRPVTDNISIAMNVLEIFLGSFRTMKQCAEE
jgi:hypothetical protein